MSERGGDFKTMSGRDVLALAIDQFDRRAEWGRSCVDAYGRDKCGDRLFRQIELDAGMANVLRVLAARGAVKLADLPKDKEGKPQFVAKVRHETTLEIVLMVAGALRGAFAAVPVIPADPEVNRDVAA